MDTCHDAFSRTSLFQSALDGSWVRISSAGIKNAAAN